MAKKVKKADKAKQKQVDKSVELKEAKAALTDYLKTNKLSRDKDYSGDKKHGKNIKQLELNIAQLSDEMDETNTKTEKVVKKEKAKEKKKEAAGREQKYDYPEGLTAAEKKKYRIKMRQEANKANKPAKEEGKAKKSKKDKEKPAKEKNLAPKEKETKLVKKDKEKSGKAKKKAKKSSKND